MSRLSTIFVFGLAALATPVYGFRATMRTEDAEHHSPEIREETLEVEVDGAKIQDRITVFRNDQMAEGMGKPNKKFPLHMQYMIWMDQAGLYGESTGMPKHQASPDGLVQVAQEGHEISAGGEYAIGDCNSGWSWYYTDAGRASYQGLRANKGACHLSVRWNNDNRTSASILNLLGTPWLTPNREKYLFQIGLELQPYWNCKLYGKACDQAKGVQCPPAEGGPRGPCAMWKRPNTAGWPVAIPIGTYYAFAVVDPEGNPVEPYFSEFLNAMKRLNVEAQFVGDVDHPDQD